MAQMSPRTAGHARLARRLPQILHKIWSVIRYSYYRISMQRMNIYIKVEIELDDDEKPERVAAEICRQIEKLYAVRSAELSSTATLD
jgi:acetolactate synthase regulatory subunit